MNTTFPCSGILLLTHSMPFWKLLFIIFDEAKLSLAYQKYHYMYLFIMISKDVGTENEVQILNTGYSSIHCFVVIMYICMNKRENLSVRQVDTLNWENIGDIHHILFYCGRDNHILISNAIWICIKGISIMCLMYHDLRLKLIFKREFITNWFSFQWFLFCIKRK